MPKAFDLHPKLRNVRIQPFVHMGRKGVLLQDPLGLSNRMLFVPQELAPLLLLMDGTRTVEGIAVAALVRFGLRIPQHTVRELVRELDRAMMLDNGRFRTVYRQALEHYRRQPYRRPSHAGQVYPEEPAALVKALQDYRQRVKQWPEPPQKPVLGVVSPHIDYARGGRVYAATWFPLSDALARVQRLVILGTDHNGPPDTVALTYQNYATPLGTLRTPKDVIERLAQAWGPEEAFTYELHHLGEHSAELALVWAHVVSQGRNFEVVPILVGSFAHYIEEGRVPWEDPRMEAFLQALAEVVQEKPTLVVAAVDLAHVGPTFGDPEPWDRVARLRLREADQELLDAIAQSDARRFFQAVAQVRDRYRICGFSPLYIYLRLMEGRPARIVDYDQCPADPEFTSVVTIAGAWTLAG